MTLAEFKEYLDNFLAHNPDLKDQEVLIYNESNGTHHTLEMVREDGDHDVVSIIIYDSFPTSVSR